MFVVRKDTTEMIEHEGMYYSPEDLAKKLEVQGEMEIVAGEDNFFSRAIDSLEKPEENVELPKLETEDRFDLFLADFKAKDNQ